MSKHKRSGHYRYGPLTTMGMPRVQFMRLPLLKRGTEIGTFGFGVRIGTHVWTVHK